MILSYLILILSNSFLKIQTGNKVKGYGVKSSNYSSLSQRDQSIHQIMIFVKFNNINTLMLV